MIDLFKKTEEILKNGGIEEYKQEAKILICEVSNLSYEQILLNQDDFSDFKTSEKIIQLAKKRAQDRIPIQQLIGHSYFMGQKYKVTSDVLIPRDETEILVNCAYELIKTKEGKIDILDIGVGSGCISCALAQKLKNKEIEILGVDISSKAIIVALENIDSQNLERKVILRKSNLFSAIRENEKFDLIVSNPPYIPINAKDTLDIEVAKFEPECALFANDIEGIDFYKKIISQAPKFIKQDGFIAFEAGVNQAELIKNLLEKDFYNVKITSDLSGIERVICAQKR